MNNDNNDRENINLAYFYREDFLKDRKIEIKQLDWRLGTFLGFAGLQLRFGIDLLNSQPSYLLTYQNRSFTYQFWLHSYSDLSINI
jgi:hypothetical protein